LIKGERVKWAISRGQLQLIYIQLLIYLRKLKAY